MFLEITTPNAAEPRPPWCVAIFISAVHRVEDSMNLPAGLGLWIASKTEIGQTPKMIYNYFKLGIYIFGIHHIGELRMI